MFDLTPRDLADLGAQLDKLRIPHGPLVETRPSNNYGASDHAHVYVKLSRTQDPDPEWGRTEILNATHAERAGLTTTRPLASTPVRLDTGRAATVWTYLPGQTWTPATMPPSALTQPLCDLAALHRHLCWDGIDTTPPGRIFTRRLAQHPDRHAVTLAHTAAGDWFDRYDALTRQTPLVPSHGDAHVGNLVGTAWIDWESVRAAPAEWDYACLSHDLYRIGGNTAAWRAVETEMTRLDLNTTVFHVCETVKALLTASWLLQFPHHTETAIGRFRVLTGYTQATSTKEQGSRPNYSLPAVSATPEPATPTPSGST